MVAVMGVTNAQAAMRISTGDPLLLSFIAMEGHPDIELSIVAPAHNEEGNMAALIEAVAAAIEPLAIAFEFLIVDDASTDATAQRVRALQSDRPWLRLISLARPLGGGGNGQSAAFKIGFACTHGRLVAVLDADLQNSPADLPAMLELLEREQADFVQGDRSAARREGDARIRQITSVIGRLFRRLILGDRVRDTGCSLRVMKREIAVRLPLEFKGLHRFIPVTAMQMGYKLVEMPVSHHPRHAGETKYGMGIVKRAFPGLIDCFAVRWMRSRRRSPSAAIEIAAESEDMSAGDEGLGAPLREHGA